jgi:hypothetical protein
VLGWFRGDISIGGDGMLTGSLAVRGGSVGFGVEVESRFGLTSGGVDRGRVVARPIAVFLSFRSGEGEVERC